jgi:dihydroflavonol-4-reductase
MKALVTGSSGFIGAATCRALLEHGYSVRAFHRATSSLRQLENLVVEHAVGDLTQPETVLAAMQDVDAVFHCAAWVGFNEPGRLYSVNVEGTRTVVQAALQAGVRRLVHTSSVTAMGIPDMGSVSLSDENRTWNHTPELFPYGYSKYLAELEVQKGVARGLDAVIVNPTLVLGPGDIYRQSSSIVRQFANRKVPVAVQGGINIIHVNDVAEGQVAALEHGSSGERYILGGSNLTYLELCQVLSQVTGVPAPGVVLPGWLLRASRGLASLVERFFELPVTTDVFVLAGRYLYYDTRKGHSRLALTEPLPAGQAVGDAYAWFLAKG